MVLACVCAMVAAWGPRVWQEPLVAPIAPRVLGTITETVDDPDSPGKKVSAQVKYTIRGELIATPIGDSFGPSIHTVQVRVETRISEVRMDDVLERLPSAGGRSLEAILRTFPPPDPKAGEAVENVLSDTAKALGDLIGTRAADPNKDLRPGGWTIRDYGFDTLKVGARYLIDREVSIGQASPRTESIEVPQVEWGTLSRFRQMPISERFLPDPNPGDPFGVEQIEVLKGWGGGAITRDDGRLEGMVFLPAAKLDYPLRQSVGLAEYGRDALGGILSITSKPIVSPELFGSVNRQSIETLASSTTFGGDDMNSLGYNFEPNAFPNCTGIGQSYFPPGTMWVPDRPGYQVMSNYQPVEIRMNFSPFAEIDPAAYVQGEFRTHCMNMDMKEPAKGVKFFPYRNTDPVVAGLMHLTNSSRIRGPWDQARLWIYTNKAGIDAINERLMLGVSEAQYLTALKQIAQLGGLLPKDYADKRLFVPKLLAGRGMAMSTLAWGFGTLETQQPKELGAWLAGFPEGLGKLLSGDKADKGHLAALMERALDSGSSDVRQGALKALLKKPQGHEALSGNLGSMRRCLLSKDASEVEMALDALRAYGGTGPRDALTYLAASGANGKIKQKAAGLLGGPVSVS